MDRLGYEMLKEAELDLKFLNSQLLNKFNAEDIYKHENISELFSEELRIQNDEDKDLIHLLQEADSMLNQIYKKITPNQEKEYIIHL